ncbi:hypothetical protein JNUCC1_02667 [Lentibacillus sp. JNUCC-1]|uniref:hypothetical protein n=1 Tax=Lentibacillus sp. JNUCC-1 TaxID=2654513 RepID=UPI0012E7CA14|nr:hypothetical protein [Lentibacillus sp. JNUCC-1]MUV38796.1 hypothetical protein [Lentibacillus sp. JNUCC-1]
MEHNTEEQILEELKNINKSLDHLNEKMDLIERDEDTSTTSDILKSLLLGLLLVGPAAANNGNLASYPKLVF